MAQVRVAWSETFFLPASGVRAYGDQQLWRPDRKSRGRPRMFSSSQNDDVFAATGPLEALNELAENTSEAIVRQRASERLEIRTKVVIAPGNSGQRHEFAAEGLTADLSCGGCKILVGRPVAVGDIYWLAFSDDHLAIGSVLARCLRCAMVREGAFEAGFRFFHEVDLASALRQHDGHEW
jgi:hypothetical protein